MGDYINREERRKRGLTKEQAETLEYYLKLENTPDDKLIDNGSKVKFKYEQITSEKDWVRKLEKYRTFVEENKDKEFTVLIEDIKVHNKYKMVSLVEDETDPKWLFWVGDLIRVDA
jgi:predicted RNA-binding protein with TRAM domain